jgi:lipoate-protein ligase A
MEIIKPTQAEWMPEVVRHIQGGIHKIGYVVIESPVAIVHRKTQVDETICRELGYEVVESFNNGGTILASPGDIIFSHLEAPDNGWIYRFADYFIQWLKSKGLDAAYEDNDILVDGFKVCGLCITRYGRIDFSSAILSVSVNLDHIKAICRKPMKKVPKGLREYGITTQEVETMFLAFCTEDERG